MTQSSQASINELPLRDKTLLSLQLIATLAILAFVPGNSGKLMCLLATWIITTRRISIKERACYIGVCILFSVMDIMAVRQHVFSFSQPDIAGLPIWEFFMWGFFVVHTLRMLNGAPSPTPLSRALPFAILMALPFMTIADPVWLTIAAPGALAVGLVFFHERDDLKYVGYTVLVGALFEYTGVWSGQWSYPGNPPGGVPFWFVAMWGGVGLYTRRLLSPLLGARHNTASQTL